MSNFLKNNVVAIIFLVAIFFLVMNKMQSCNQPARAPKIIVSTSIVHDSIPYPVPVLKIVHAPTVLTTTTRDMDTIYRASSHIESEKDTVDITYFSPIPLSPRGVFDMEVRRAPLWKYIDTVFVRTTITEYSVETNWFMTSIIGLVLFLIGHFT